MRSKLSLLESVKLFGWHKVFFMSENCDHLSFLDLNVVLSGPVREGIQVEEVLENPTKFDLGIWVMGNTR